MKNILYKSIITIMTICAVAGIIILSFNLYNNSNLASNILLSILVIYCYSIPELCCTAIYDKKHRKPLSIAGLIICFLSCLYIVLSIYNIMPLNFFKDSHYDIMFIAPFLSISSVHLCLLALVEAKNKIITVLQILTLASSVLFDIIITVSMLSRFNPSLLLIGLPFTLIILGTIATPIANTTTATQSKAKHSKQ